MNPISRLSDQKRAFLTGTLLLTGTGFLCRILGFFYRIFLSRTIGAEGLGLYHMIHPVFGICFALCAGSVQTALSQFIASHRNQGNSVFHIGLGISMTMSFLLSFLICRHADFLAAHVLMEPRCAAYLPVMGISVPFAAFHACINGYYYGMQNAKIPAFSQVAEQLVRMGLVFLLASLWIKNGSPVTVQLAALGHLIGEIASAAFTLLCLCILPPKPFPDEPVSVPENKPERRAGFLSTAAPLLALALPLMGNRLVLNLLAGAEAILIPSRLQMAGLSGTEACSVYGVLTGMALPFILFPSAITNSMAVLLLPSVAKAQAEGRQSRIASSISMSLRYSLYMGIFCIGIFTLFGKTLGTGVFHNKDAGRFIQILAWLCPFLYLSTTMGSILNGLGRTRTTFLHNTAALLLRLAFVLVGIPKFGIFAYLSGMLASELLLACLHLASLKRLVPFFWNAAEMLLKPAVLLLISVGIFYFADGIGIFPQNMRLPVFVKTAVQIVFVGGCYGGLLMLLHVRKRVPARICS